MGFFDFARTAGKKLGFGDDDAENAKALKSELDSLGLGTDAVSVAVKGDTAELKGAVEDQSVFEKAILAVGNTLGIARVEASELKVVAPDSGLALARDMTALVAASTPAGPARFHTVEKGDTLWAIAKAAYGDGTTYNAIFEANRPMLGDPDAIYPGQVLRIPALD